MDQHFSSLNSQILRDFRACNPGSDNFPCEEDLRGLADHYSVDLKPEQMLVAKNFLAKQQKSILITDMDCVFSLLDQAMFPTLTQVIQISLTIPVSSCTCEQIFGVLRRPHTWLRSTMGEDINITILLPCHLRGAVRILLELVSFNFCIKDGNPSPNPCY